MKLRKLVLVVLCGVFSCSLAFAKVSSIGGEVEVENDNGIYTQIAVQCQSQSDKLFLRKAAGDKQWCDSTLGQFCDREKVAAARKVCRRKYVSAVRKQSAQKEPVVAKVAAVEPSKKAQQASQPKSNSGVIKARKNNVESLVQEQFDIEQKTLEIEARKLELWRRELALRKQQLSLTQN